MWNSQKPKETDISLNFAFGGNHSMNKNANVLSSSQSKAIEELKDRASKRFSIKQIIVFGSVARGEAEEGSDLDVLLVTNNQLSHRERHEIYNQATEIDWKYDTNISVTIVDEYNWQQGCYSVLPIKTEIQQDGIVL